jgi:Holliday junction resolvase RusA-like endonuclease
MSRGFTLVIPGPVPSKANTYRRAANGGLYADPAVQAFAGTVYLVMQVARITPLTGDVAVEVTLYPPNNRGDLAGCEKALLDALQDWRYGPKRKRFRLAYGCYHDDRQVKRLVLQHGGVDKQNPRAEVTITPLDQ